MADPLGTAGGDARSGILSNISRWLRFGFLSSWPTVAVFEDHHVPVAGNLEVGLVLGW